MTAFQSLGLTLLWSLCAVVAAELVWPFGRGAAEWLFVSTLGALVIWGAVRLLMLAHEQIK